MSDQLWNLRFVREVERHPELYNYHLKGYSRKDVTEKAWNEVAKEFRITVRDCKDKWKNIRSVFVRHQKISSKNKRPYYLADAMKFTLPFIKTQGMLIENLQEVTSRLRELEVKREQISPDVSETSRDVASEDETGIVVYDEIELQPETSSSHERDDFFQELAREPPSPKQNEKKRKRMATDEDNTNEESVREKARKQQQHTDTSNCSIEEKRMFLLSLLPEIEPLTDSQMRSFRRKVLQLIDDIAYPSDATSTVHPTD